MGTASPAAAVGIGIGVGVLSGMGVTALAQTGVATALGKKIDYLQFAKQMAIGATIGAVTGSVGLGITAATQGVAAVGTQAAMLQIAITPTDGGALYGMAKTKIQGGHLRNNLVQTNGMIGYKHQMKLDEVTLETQLIKAPSATTRRTQSTGWKKIEPRREESKSELRGDSFSANDTFPETYQIEPESEPAGEPFTTNTFGPNTFDRSTVDLDELSQSFAELEQKQRLLDEY